MIALAALASSLAHAGQSEPRWPSNGAEARLAERFAGRGISYPPQSVTLVALKSEARLELWAGSQGAWTFVRSYLVQTTSGQLGPKLRQGDHQVPEGIYRVTALNPRSLYHLALRVDYPNAFDEARASEDGRQNLGGDIMVHGDRVSDGCLPVGDDAVEELFALAARIGVENVAVIISPMDLRRAPAAAALARAGNRPPWLAELYAEVEHALRDFPLPATEVRPMAGSRVSPPRATGGTRCAPYNTADCVRRCERGEMASCAHAGILYRGGRGVAADTMKAWSLLSRACASGEALGCGALSDLVVADDGLRRDAGGAAALARTACDGGDGHGCARLAQLCSDRLFYPERAGECSKENVMRLRQRAVTRLVSSCTGWGAYDCFTLATIYAAGDRATALRFATGSCATGDRGGCDLLRTLSERTPRLGSLSSEQPAS
jgi:TPR repeat protein